MNKGISKLSSRASRTKRKFFLKHMENSMEKSTAYYWLLIILVVPSIILYGFVGVTLIEWFLVPHGFPIISIPEFLGGSSAVRFAITTSSARNAGCNDNDEIDDVFAKFMRQNLLSVKSLVLGWIMLQFI
jgi:hypothetical protein